MDHDPIACLRYLETLGRIQESRVLQEELVKQDPANSLYPWGLALIDYISGRFNQIGRAHV